MKTLINNLILCSLLTLVGSTVAVAQAPHIRGTYRVSDRYIGEVVQNSDGITLYLEVPEATILMNAEYGQCAYTAPNGQSHILPGFHGFFRTMFKDGRVKEGCCRIFQTKTYGAWEMQTYFCVNDQWVLENSVSMVNVTQRPSFPPAPDWDTNPSPQPQPLANQPQTNQPLSSDDDEFRLMPAGLSDLGI